MLPGDPITRETLPELRAALLEQAQRAGARVEDRGAYHCGDLAVGMLLDRTTDADDAVGARRRPVVLRVWPIAGGVAGGQLDDDPPRAVESAAAAWALMDDALDRAGELIR